MNITAFNPNPPLLYHGKTQELSFSIRPFKLDETLNQLHSWVNQPYAKRFWQMEGTLRELYKYYDDIIKKGKSNPFWIYKDNTPLAFFEVYEVGKFVLSQKYKSSVGDYGIHTLMAPPRQLLASTAGMPDISVLIMKSILQFLFTFSCITRVVTEPDINNVNANKLAERSGFLFDSIIDTDHKNARLYICNKTSFLADNINQVPS